MTLDYLTKAAEAGKPIHKAFELAQFKELDTPTGGFEAYASTFGNIDRHGDRIMQGAFSEDLPRFLRDGFIAVGHDWNVMGIGYPTEAREDAIGLFLAAQYHGDPEAQLIRKRVNERIAAGKSQAVSIGFFIRDWEVKDNVFQITRAELHEVSLVTVPANPSATLVSAKGIAFGDDGDAIVEAARMFAARTKSREEARLKEGREMSSANVAVIDRVSQSLYELASEATTQAEALKELADRNRKGLASEPNVITSATDADMEREIARFHRLEHSFTTIGATQWR